MSDITVSIIILDYLKSNRVVKNISNIIKQKVDFEYEIIVIDNSVNEMNASILKKAQKKFKFHLYINKKNLGYIKAHNLAVKKAKGEYLFIINPDIEIRDIQSLKHMVNFMKRNKKIGVLGPKQINDDGSIAMTVRKFPKISLQIARRTFLRKLPIIRSFVAHDECRDLNYNKTQDVDWLQSSFWLTRKMLWNKMGGLNKKYFLFMSDADYCFNIWRLNYEVIYFPKVTVYADGIRASAGGFSDFFKKWVIRQHLKDSIVYRLKYMFKKDPRKNYLKNVKSNINYD